MKADSWTDDFISLVAEYQPAAVWLFGNERRDQHQRLISGLKTVGRGWDLQVIAQVGNVSIAREAMHDGIDILAVQGTDAGGHQFRQGAGLMTVLPEVCDMLAAEFPGRRVPVLAAGGIMSGRGAAAALALGKFMFWGGVSDITVVWVLMLCRSGWGCDGDTGGCYSPRALRFRHEACFADIILVFRHEGMSVDG